MEKKKQLSMGGKRDVGINARRRCLRENLLCPFCLLGIQNVHMKVRISVTPHASTINAQEGHGSYRYKR